MRFAAHARAFSFLVLALITGWGVYAFATGDWHEVAGYWRDKVPLLPWILLFVVADVAFEGCSWIWVYERLGIPARDLRGAGAYLAGRAGLLMPAQLGRLIRPDSLARLGRAPLSRCLQAEATSFVLDATSVGSLLVGLLAWQWHPAAAPVALLATVSAALYLGNVIAERIAGTHLALPTGFWWSWRTFAIVGLQLVGWTAHGVALYLMIHDLPGDVTLWSCLFFSAAASVAGVGSGLPGGIGATEGLLGASLRYMQVPAAHLALAVGAFRIVTFWAWIPIGWVALVALRRSVAVEQPEVAARQPAI